MATPGLGVGIGRLCSNFFFDKLHDTLWLMKPPMGTHCRHTAHQTIFLNLQNNTKKNPIFNLHLG